MSNSELMGRIAAALIKAELYERVSKQYDNTTIVLKHSKIKKKKIIINILLAL